MKDHVVASGECLSSISFQSGFHWKTLWDHPKNAALRARRQDPFSLAPGDVVHVPDLEPKKFRRATGSSHKFRRKGVPERLRLRLLDDAGRPRANEPYELEVDGVSMPGDLRTDGDGWLEHFISPDARVGRLSLQNGEIYELQIGEPWPHDTLQGAQHRLRSLGFLTGGADGELDEATADAIEDFQVFYGLEPSGELLPGTVEKLREAYGG